MIHGSWSQFTINTDVDEGTTIPVVMDLLRATDEATVNKCNTYWQRRLAYLQLHRNLQVLKRIVGRQRRRRQIDRSRGRGNSSIALEIYSNALQGKAGNYVAHQMRLAKRWSLSLRKSLFLAVAYSDFAETRMYAIHPMPVKESANSSYLVRIFPQRKRICPPSRARQYKQCASSMAIRRCTRSNRCEMGFTSVCAKGMRCK